MNCLQRTGALFQSILNNIFKEKELRRDRTIRKFRIVQQEGSRSVERLVDFYNHDVIISVGYRVKSQRGTQFRIWATQVLKDHIQKGGFTDNAIAGIKRNQRRGMHDKTNRVVWHGGNSLPYCESARTDSYSGC
ncbi:MAG: virulence RhuM family protein [Proteobacteria bacterium]|nr:virulence RhuM family protein [Pseudomonadota bacterium]